LSGHKHAGHEYAGQEHDHREHGSYENEDEALKDDLSTHSAYLHVLGDALSSAGVTAALDIWKTG
jgi:Co/Zn/Cd efflux system component